MKEIKNKVVLKLIIFIIIVALIAITIFMVKENKYTGYNLRAVVLRVNKNSLSVMRVDTDNHGDLITVSFANEGNIGFKIGQEVLVCFDGMISYSFPAQIHRVGKIEILKEESEVQIPEKVLKFYYSSRDNVKISIDELTNKGITLSITDTNTMPYNYSNEYTIKKLVKNKDYKNSTGYKIGEDTENSISGYVRTRSRIYI